MRLIHWGAALIVTSLFVGGTLVLLRNSANAQLNERLIAAAEAGAIGDVKALLSKGADINSTTRRGESPLMVASRQGHGEVVTVLLKKGAHRDSRDSNGSAPLTEAVLRGHVQIVRVLLEHGAAVDTQTRIGVTPLMIAAREGRVEILNLLVRAGADPAKRDTRNMRAIDFARLGRSSAHRQAVLLLQSAKPQ